MIYGDAHTRSLYVVVGERLIINLQSWKICPRFTLGEMGTSDSGSSGWLKGWVRVCEKWKKTTTPLYQRQ